MVEAIQTFINTIKERGHVLKLIEKLDWLEIKLVCEKEESFLVFHQGEIFIVENQEKTVSGVISGQADSLIKLLEGKEKLKNLVVSGQLIVKAPYRTVLLLESIFFLTKAKENKYYNKSIDCVS